MVQERVRASGEGWTALHGSGELRQKGLETLGFLGKTEGARRARKASGLNQLS